MGKYGPREEGNKRQGHMEKLSHGVKGNRCAVGNPWMNVNKYYQFRFTFL